jgi:hypothetical protein
MPIGGMSEMRQITNLWNPFLRKEFYLSYNVSRECFYAFNGFIWWYNTGRGHRCIWQIP